MRSKCIGPMIDGMWGLRQSGEVDDWKKRSSEARNTEKGTELEVSMLMISV